MGQSSANPIEPSAAKAIARAISFSQTSTELLSGKKTCTRRIWKDKTARLFTRYFNEGRSIPAYDKSPRNGGVEIARILLTSAPYLEKLADMPLEDLDAEGGMCKTVEDFCDRYFQGNLALKVWVIRFKIQQSHSTVNSQQLTFNSSTNKKQAIALKNKLLKLFGNQPQSCWCGQCKAETNWENEDLYYKCAGCDRIVPYCFGQADKYFDYCDDCAVYLSKSF